MDLFVLLLPVGVLALVGIVHHVTYARPLRRIRHGVCLMERGYPEALLEVQGPRHMQDLARSVWSLGREVETRMRGLVEAEQRGLGAAASAPTPLALGATLADEPKNNRHAHGGDSALVPIDPVIERLRERCLELENGEPDDPAIRELAREVWEFDVELAARRGALALRSRLDDAALRALDRPAYDQIVTQLAAAGRSPANRLGTQKAIIQKALEGHGIAIHALDHRIKHVAGIWRKMAALGLPFEQIQDVFGLRVVVPDVGECYRTLAVLHHAFVPQLFSFDDYIARPKPSGYRSLHTHLLLPGGLRVEVQIRSVEMHRAAESGRGAAAHWQYKAAMKAMGPGSSRRSTPSVARVA